MKHKFLLGFSLIATLSGCTNVVKVLEPSEAHKPNGGLNWASQPIREIVVQIGGNYVSSFSADLNGTDITSSFSPAAAKNTTVTAQKTSCYSGGTVIPNGSGRHIHEIIARANSSVDGFKIDNAIRHFIPPLVKFQPSGNIQVLVGQTVTVQMNLTDGPTAAVPVALDPDTTDISINGATNGATVTTSIPDNNVSSFTITGVAPGPFHIAVQARGVQCKELSGTVSQR